MRTIIFLVLVIGFSFQLFSQEGKKGRAFYSRQNDFSFIDNNGVDSVKTINRNFDFNELINVSNKKFQYILEFNNYESVFEIDKKLDLDDNDLRLASMFGGNGIYYINIINKESFRQVESFGDLFLIKRDFNLFKWKLLNETKKIGDFLCYKAITTKIVENDKIFKKQVIAWYCPEYSIPFGPIGYGGLPGLIIELSIENEATYLLNKIEINPTQSNEIIKPIKGIEVTEREYNEIGKDLFKKMVKLKF